MGRFHAHINRQNCKCCKYEVCQMLLVLIMILCPNVLAIKDAANARNATKAGVSINEASVLATRNETAKVNTNSRQLIKLEAFESLRNESIVRSISPIELVFKNNSNTNYASLQARLSRDSYNISLPTTNANDTGNSPIALTSGQNSTATLIPALKTTESTNKTAEDELNTSDSRLIPQTISSDDEVEQAGGGGNVDDSTPSSSSDDNVEVWADGAGSTISEKKAVKELTKLLSKGMSGAANQVRLETLENWKRRQKERKVAKESRAKLFEDLLTTAISTHPEKTKKATSANGNKRQRTMQNKEESIQKGLYGSGVPGLRDVSGIDPESAEEAENVLLHLQNIAANYDGRQQSSLGGGEEAVIPSEDGSSQSVEDSAGEPSEASSNTDETDGSSDGRGNALITSKKKPESSDRPIVRQFKKIKQQFSNRRKQLDQIKKLFNVELALNPKDGGLVGKSLGSKKKETGKDSSSYESGDYLAIDEPSVSKRKSSKSAKMRELMGYLKDNPEILASVMSELTVDSDPTRQAAAIVTSGGDDGGGSIGEEQSELGSASNRKSIKQQQQNDIGAAWERRKSISKLLDSAHLDESRLLSLLSSRRTRSRSGESIHLLEPTVPNSIAPIDRQVVSLRPKSAESLLLESLRERQLMNLARLDLVLAEKQRQLHQQIVANRTISTHANSIYTPSLPSLQDGETAVAYNRGEPEISDQALEQRQPLSSSPQEPLSSSAEEETPQQQYDIQTGPDHQYEPSHMSVSNNARSSSSSHQGGHQQQLHYNQSDHHVHHQPASQHRQYLPEKQRQYSPEQPRSYLPEQRHHSSDQQRSYLLDQHQSRPHQSYQQQQQQQQPQQDQEQQYAAQTTQSNSRVNKQNSLNRFTNWRDVSQSETSSSQRSGKTNLPSNITWVAYDLTTGSSSANVEAHRTGSPPAASVKQLHSNQRPLELSSTYDNQSQSHTPPGIGANQQHRQQQQQVINYSDSTITRPGAQFRGVYQATANTYPMNGPIKPSASISVTSSIAADNDHELTTGDPQSPVVEFEMQSDQEDRRHKLISRDGAESGTNSLVDNNDGGFTVEQPVSEVSRQLSPVDYFSAYKQEMINNSQSSTARQISKRVNGPELVPQKSSRSEAGAMWA